MIWALDLGSDGHRFEAGAGQAFPDLKMKVQVSRSEKKNNQPLNNLFVTSKNLKQLQRMGLIFDAEMKRENFCIIIRVKVAYLTPWELLTGLGMYFVCI